VQESIHGCVAAARTRDSTRRAMASQTFELVEFLC